MTFLYQVYYMRTTTSSLYTDVVLFLFSFFSKTSASSRAKRAREKEKEI